jgi:hypothetical protein
MSAGIGDERDVAAGGAGVVSQVATQIDRGPVVGLAVQDQERRTSVVRRHVATVWIEGHEATQPDVGIEVLDRRRPQHGPSTVGPADHAETARIDRGQGHKVLGRRVHVVRPRAAGELRTVAAEPAQPAAAEAIEHERRVALPL